MMTFKKKSSNIIFKKAINDIIKHNHVNLKSLKELKYKHITNKEICNICCDIENNTFLFCCNSNVCKNCNLIIQNDNKICPFCRCEKYDFGYF